MPHGRRPRSNVTTPATQEAERGTFGATEMSKPTGLAVRVDECGVRFAVSHSSRVGNAVWDAVQTAVDAGWSPEQFKREVADAWQEKLRDDARHANKVLND